MPTIIQVEFLKPVLVPGTPGTRVMLTEYNAEAPFGEHNPRGVAITTNDAGDLELASDSAPHLVTLIPFAQCRFALARRDGVAPSSGAEKAPEPAATPVVESLLCPLGCGFKAKNSAGVTWHMKQLHGRARDGKLLAEPT